MARLSHHQNAIGEYRPIAMKFDGLTGGFIKEHTPVGQSFYAMGRFRSPPFYGPSFLNGVKTPLIVYGNGTTLNRARLHIYLCGGSRTFPAANYRFGFNSRSDADVVTLQLLSKREYADNAWHSFLISWNAATAEFVFKVDGEDADDVTQPDRIAPAINTMGLVANSPIYVGQTGNFTSIGVGNSWAGEISCLAYGNGYLTNYSDFFFPNNLPKRLDHAGWTEFGGGTFSPPMSLFDGTTGWYSKAYTSSTQAFTVVLGVTALPLAGTTRRIFRIESPAGYSTGSLEIYASDHATAPGKLVFYSANSINSAIFSYNTSLSFDDGLLHLVFFSFSAATGLYTVIVDGQVPEFSAVPTAIISTFGVGAGSGVGVGALESGSQKHNGHISFFGYRDVYMTNWQDFMTHDGKPVEIDEGSWRQWRTQPLLWHKAGQMEESTGSLGPMVKNGTITYVPGSQPLIYHPYCDLENNMGMLGRMRRGGKCAPVVSDVLLRGTKDAPQNQGGIVLQWAPPRTAISPILWDRSYFQHIADGAITQDMPTGWSVDANGYAYKDLVWATLIHVMNLPAKASTTRMYRLDFRFEDAAPPGTNPGLVMGFNYVDGNNWWRCILYWNGSAWLFAIGDVTLTVWTVRATTTVISNINYPLQGNITVFDGGDDLVATLQLYEVDVPTDQQAVSINYTGASRPSKTGTGVLLSNHEDPNTFMRFKNFLVMDM